MSSSNFITRTYGWSKHFIPKRPDSVPESKLPKIFQVRNVGQIEYGKLQIPESVWQSVPGYDNLKVIDVEVHWLNKILFTEVIFTNIFSNTFQSSDLLGYWDSLYDFTSTLEVIVYKYLGLDESLSSIWQTPLSLAQLPNEPQERDKIKKMLADFFGASESRKTPEKLFMEDILVGSSWDGAFVFCNLSKNESRLSAEFLYRLVCLVWAINENTKTEVYIEITKSSPFEGNRIIALQNLITEYYNSIAKADPFYLTYAESDVEFVKAVERSWDLSVVRSETQKLINELHQIYSITLERNQIEVAQRAAKKQDLLNIILGWIGITGIAGTVAGVLSFIDNFNTFFDTFIRITSIVVSTGLFTLWVWWKLRFQSKDG